MEDAPLYNGERVETPEYSEIPGKVKITTYLDADIKAELKKRAGKTEGYQTYMNRLLRDSLFGKPENAVLDDVVQILIQCADKLGIDASRLSK